MLTELQIGYLAGILDGEGGISIAKNIRKDGTRKRDYALTARVGVTQRRRILLSTILDWIGRENGHIGRTGLENKFFLLRFKADWLRKNLPFILPHLILKRRQAEIVITFLNFPRCVGRHGVGDENWLIRNKLRDECVALNMDRTNALR